MVLAPDRPKRSVGSLSRLIRDAHRGGRGPDFSECQPEGLSTPPTTGRIIRRDTDPYPSKCTLPGDRFFREIDNLPGAQSGGSSKPRMRRPHLAVGVSPYDLAIRQDCAEINKSRVDQIGSHLSLATIPIHLVGPPPIRRYGSFESETGFVSDKISQGAPSAVCTLKASKKALQGAKNKNFPSRCPAPR